jgi:hypothetical protein
VTPLARVSSVVVAVRGSQQHHQTGALRQVDAGERRRFADTAEQRLHRRVEAQHLLDERCDERAVGPQLGLHVRSFEQHDERVSEQVRGGLVAGDQQQDAEVDQLVERQRVRRTRHGPPS